MINVLCLHGCNQTQAAFESYMKDYIKLSKQYNLNLVFTEAKYDHPLGKKFFLKILNFQFRPRKNSNDFF